MQPVDIECDLMIIGTGLAGMASALFAARHGIDTVQAGLVGQLGFSSGLIDLLGLHPVPGAKSLRNPWAGISRLVIDEPNHPYCRLGTANIRKALETVLAELGKCGYPHHFQPDRNLTIMTPAGTTKPTFAVPHTMAHGPEAMAAGAPCMILDFEGMKGFSARQIALSMKEKWAALRPVNIRIPGTAGELNTESMARSFDLPDYRRKLVEAVAPHVGDAHAVGMPAVLGVHRTLDVMTDLSQSLGVRVFEIPTMPPGIPGLRLQEIFEQHLAGLGIRLLLQKKILEVERTDQGDWIFSVGHDTPRYRVKARAAILCSGRFFGKGLHAKKTGIRETVFGLPVFQPADRESWYKKDLLHPQGHPVNRCGIEIDDDFRPVDSTGRPSFPNLFAAGIILAHQDWMRQKCGSGLALATAHGAVRACSRFLGKTVSPSCLDKNQSGP